ncbi:MAG: hypothetical protein ACRDGA_09415, partial [Bacteroidota bacterium]
MKRIVSLSVLLLSLLVVGSSASFGQATTIYVATTGNDANSGTHPDTAKATIQAGIDAVDAGGTVNVAVGSYNLTGSPSSGASVDIGKSLTLQASDYVDGTPDNTTTILVGMESKAIDLRITSPSVTVQGFTFDFNGAGTRAIGGIEINGNPDLTNIHI